MSTPSRTSVLTPEPIIHPGSESLRAEMRRRLLSLNYHAFLRCVCRLLAELGYEDARPAGRTDWKGRNRDGGYDVEAWLPGGVGGQRRVVVSCKQFDVLPVYQRQADELRGAALRAGAAEAVLVTTSAFSPVMKNTNSGPAAALTPVRLVDGEALLDLMLARRVGVWEEPGGSADEPARRGVDRAFFDALERDYPGTGRRRTRTDRTGAAAQKVRHAGRAGGECARLLVTISLGSVAGATFSGKQQRLKGARSAGRRR
jgi:hypothetical protein